MEWEMTNIVRKVTKWLVGRFTCLQTVDEHWQRNPLAHPDLQNMTLNQLGLSTISLPSKTTLAAFFGTKLPFRA
jgi:hypothetical protein